MRWFFTCLCVCVVVTSALPRLSATEGSAGPKSETSAKENGDKPEEHEVKKERLQVAVSLDGAFVSENGTEISLRPRRWTDFVVTESVSHGTAVKKGDVLLKLDRVKIDQELKDEAAAQEQAQVSLSQLEAELAATEPNVDTEMELAERAKKNADEDLEHFVQTDRPLSEKSAEYNVKSAQQMVNYYKDELDQLEKMYQADDLTEETEEIILRRQREWYEIALFYLEQAKASRERTLTRTLPRSEESLQENVNRRRIELERKKLTLPVAVAKLKADIAKHKYDRTKASEKIEQLTADAELFTVLAPCDGVVYFGACRDGEWKTSAALSEKLRPGGNISPHEIVMTVVSLEPIWIHATVAEKDLEKVRANVKGHAKPVASSNQRMPVAVETVATVPDASGKYPLKIRIDGNGSDEQVRAVPGMKCTVRLISHDAPDVLCIPETALCSDEYDDAQHYVMLANGQGEHERRTVRVGLRNDKLVEITEGLAEGDKVLKSKPEKS